MSFKEGRWALLLGIVVHAFFIVSLGTQTLNDLFIESERSFGQAADYFGIYQAGDNLVHGWSIYDSGDYRDEAQRRVPYFYFYRYLPPTAYFAALGSLTLTPWAGYWTWVAITEALLVILVLWILHLEAYPIRERRWYAGLWLGFFPFYLEQWMGQFSFLMAAFLWIILRDGLPDAPPRWRGTAPAGRALRAWIASVGLKSFTALLALSYLRRRRIRPVLLCAGIVILACAPYYLARPDDLKQFLLLNFKPLPPGVHGGTLGAAAFVRLLGWLLPRSFAEKRLVLGSQDVYVGNLPVLAFSTAVALLTLFLVWKRGRRMAMNAQVALWVLAFFLVFKDVWEYHYVMLLPVVTALGLGLASRFPLWIGLALALPTPYVLFGTDGTLPVAGDLLQHASKAVPAILLFAWLVRRSPVETLRRPALELVEPPRAGDPSSTGERSGPVEEPGSTLLEAEAGLLKLDVGLPPRLREASLDLLRLGLDPPRAQALGEAEERPAVVRPDREVLAVDRFRLFDTPRLQENPSQRVAHRLHPVGRLVVAQRVLDRDAGP
jgi:hypothetical protein